METERVLIYDIVPSFYTANAHVQLDRYCNGVTVVNIGLTNMTVNQVPLAPPIAPALLGEAQIFGGNRNELFRGRIDVGFTAGAGSRCIVIQKVYVQYEDEKKVFDKK
jgi:hypothetical protein